MAVPTVTTQTEWRQAIEALPSTPSIIPAFFLAHGSPFLAFSESEANSHARLGPYAGPTGPLATFLKEFGPALLKKYEPKGILVFSAHWETFGTRLVTDYGDENPLLMDYFGFQPSMYQLKFKSRGDANLSQRIVQLYHEAGQSARTTSKLEARGEDGRGFEGPGLDHGVFVPFKLMFGEELAGVPVVQVSIDSSLSPEKNWALGQAVAKLREEGILIISGGLTFHNLRDFAGFAPDTCKPIHREFDRAIFDAVTMPDPDKRKQAMVNLVKHPGFRASQPREDHFVPLYVAAGAGEGGGVRVVTSLYGAPTFAFVSLFTPKSQHNIPLSCAPMPSLAVIIPDTSPLSPEASRRPSMVNSIASGRRESQTPRAPITPPLSPGNSELGGEAMVTDEEPRNGGAVESKTLCPANTGAAIATRSDSESLAMDVDRDTATSPNRPLRLLEDEQVHLQKSGLKLSDFEVRGTLGSGTFARVLLVRHRLSTAHPSAQTHFAMKVLRKTDIVKLRQVEHVNAERYILSRVSHPFVVDLFATFQDSVNVYMLMSYVPGGELFTHLRRAHRFTPDVTRFYLATIILALKYLHSFNIIYRDLKPENLLLDARGYLRLTDFGFAKIVDDRTWTLCGTPEYLAPEIIQSDGHGKAADWWACGVLCYEMLVGYPPFFDESPYGIYEKILNGHIHWPRTMDPLSRDLIRAFLNPDRTKRLGNMIGGPQDILDHPWFRGVDWGALERREINAPIIPHTSSVDDTRHFVHQPLPSADEMPGLVKEEQPLALHQRFDPIAYQFLEF
ncbi:hypothetical protein DXG01_015112 [Tephrocybe rancida]|nr:hypothetical protein DXG01_015112 [Tephrocybe rancida]